MWEKLVLILCVTILVNTKVEIIKAENSVSDKSKRLSVEEQEESDLLVAKDKIEQVISKVAQAKNLNLSPAAKDFITKEIINREIYKGVPLSKIKISNTETSLLVDAIADKAKGEELTAGFVVSVIEEEKIKQERAAIRKEIPERHIFPEIELTDEAGKLLQDDLLIQTEQNAKSGLPIQEIESRNEGYINAIYTSATSKVLNEKAYNQAKKVIFQPLIKLTICSIPSGADVEIAGVRIGETTIGKKPFEPGDYSFIFELSGYKTSVRKYYVSSHPSEQKFTEILIKK